MDDSWFEAVWKAWGAMLALVIGLVLLLAAPGHAVEFGFTDYELAAPTSYKQAYFGKGGTVGVVMPHYQFGEVTQADHQLLGLSFGLGPTVETAGGSDPVQLTGDLSADFLKGLVSVGAGGSLTRPHGMLFGFLVDVLALGRKTFGATPEPVAMTEREQRLMADINRLPGAG